MSQHWDDRDERDFQAFLDEMDRVHGQGEVSRIAIGPLAIAQLEELNKCEICDTRRGVMILRNAGRICGTCWAAWRASLSRFVRRNGSETQ
jgi:hypothetical protein